MFEVLFTMLLKHQTEAAVSFDGYHPNLSKNMKAYRDVRYSYIFGIGGIYTSRLLSSCIISSKEYNTQH